MKFTGRRDFLKQTGLIGSVAMMAGSAVPESALALGGERGAVIGPDSAIRRSAEVSHQVRRLRHEP